MKIKKFRSVASLGITVLTTGIILSSCTCKIKDEQLAELAELRRKEKAISSEITTQQNLKAKLDREVQARAAEVKNCNERLEVIRQRSSNWPNVWTDNNVKP